MPLDIGGQSYDGEASSIGGAHLHRNVSLRNQEQEAEIDEQEDVSDEEVHPSTAGQRPPPKQPNLITYSHDVIVHNNSCLMLI